MSRGFTPRHAQMAGYLGFAVQMIAESLWHPLSNNSKGNSIHPR